MTGYGRARETRSGRDITVEVRSVNNRYLDCTVKMPRAYIFAEDAVKARVQKAVSRGKVDVFITIDTSAADEAVVKLNRPLAQGYYKALCEINEACGLESEISADSRSAAPTRYFIRPMRSSKTSSLWSFRRRKCRNPWPCATASAISSRAIWAIPANCRSFLSVRTISEFADRRNCRTRPLKNEIHLCRSEMRQG